MLCRSLRKWRIASAASHREQKDSKADDTSDLHGLNPGTVTAKRLQAQRLSAKRDLTNSTAVCGHKSAAATKVTTKRYGVRTELLAFEISFN